MSDYTDSLRQAQQKVNDLLATQQNAIEPGIQKTQDLIMANRPKYQRNVQDITGQVAGRYGLNAPVVQAGNESVERATPKLNRQLGENLDRSRMARQQQLYSTVFNTAFDNFVKAGASVEEANARARQVALTQSDQAFQASQAEEARKVAQERQDISDRYGAFQQSLIPADPYEQAVVSALANSAGQAGTAWALGAFKSPSANIPSVSGGNNYPSLRANSMFGYRNQYPSKFNDPYSLDVSGGQ